LAFEIGNIAVFLADIVVKQDSHGKQNGSQNYSKQKFVDPAKSVHRMADFAFPIERQKNDEIIGKKNQDFSAFKLDIFSIQPVDCPNRHRNDQGADPESGNRIINPEPFSKTQPRADGDGADGTDGVGDL
jgi:hypothetical protein